MKAGFIRDIDKCIEAAAAPGGPSVTLVAGAGQTPEGLFILAYTGLFRKFGAPDYPSLDGGGDSRSSWARPCSPCGISTTTCRP